MEQDRRQIQALAMKRLRHSRAEAGIIERKILLPAGGREVILRLKTALNRTEQEVAGALAVAAATLLLQSDIAAREELIASIARTINMDERDVARVMSGESAREARVEEQLPLELAS